MLTPLVVTSTSRGCGRRYHVARLGTLNRFSWFKHTSQIQLFRKKVSMLVHFGCTSRRLVSLVAGTLIIAHSRHTHAGRRNKANGHNTAVVHDRARHSCKPHASELHIHTTLTVDRPQQLDCFGRRSESGSLGGAQPHT